MILPGAYDTLSPSEAIAIQQQMREQIDIRPLESPIKYIGGSDISFNKYEDTVYAGIIVLTYPDMVPVERVTVITETKFPYISGLLAFREIPALLLAWDQLKIRPDVMVLDGQGIAHQRRTGIATHFGLLKDVPTIGSAKSRLTGIYTEPENVVFAQEPLMHQKEQIGIVLKTKLNCKPIFVSPGHKVGMQQSVDIIKNCSRKYRIPEPTRLAHLLVNEARIRAKEGDHNTLFGD
ncbi:deoxyribonuclease V [Taibaiella sp. KBW10]|uniref:deoxyribonuclease V n=1 Tax=Taibaiella sp. KBW10 TaxID=2153357 RepID=UPI000F5B7645|nr:deoxyribonuclease V [Taibaiella sp. KBW10]RQO32078.1 deoxyribonuclease V [Taibaiella sp. KBW10]